MRLKFLDIRFWLKNLVPIYDDFIGENALPDFVFIIEIIMYKIYYLIVNVLNDTIPNMSKSCGY